MNFVLHHHLGARDLGSPAAGVGAMLPDLWRMADRRVRARGGHAGGDPEIAEVLAGIDHHLAVDRWFHADPVFTEGEDEAAERLQAARIEAPRTVLFAHVLWELCLDGALLQELGLAPVLASLGEGLRAARAGAAKRAAEIHHFGRVTRTDDERASFERRMDRIFDELARGPWIDGYRSGSGIAERIGGVRARLGLDPMSPDDGRRFAAVADALLERAPAAVAEILHRAKPASIRAGERCQ